MSPIKYAMLFGILVLGLASCVACTQLNDVRSKVGLPPVADISAACETLPTETAEASEIARTGNRVACEAFAGLLGYEVAQQSVISLQEAADGSGDEALIKAAIKAGEIEAKAAPVAQALNRAIDAFVYLHGEVVRYEAEGVPPPQTLLIEAAAAYGTLTDKWAAAKPIFDQLGEI
ncbi:hypothetical protein D1227_06525 [Henriciella mobilis]|uniref:hypothetical protein n=1 Tax=Henriciella mobilis TaxID=2305467 RepID=UPI000E667948|nr:hypothetical protein [Henriciella mobilis]RIJ15936.1 hypothetical protein D1231_09075 [Henriciella mobilis]RIJ21146.1 hypothetical protein D1227_12615 [Henriciella mobilis]RIJ23154.1 hypothetical protein D1227_06525 [Henriciella mobilis]